MDLSQAEHDNLKAHRFWDAWMQEHLPKDFVEFLNPTQHHILLNTLQHYHHSHGRSVNIYGDGAILVTKDIQDHLVKQLRDLLEHNICRTHITSCFHPKLGGKSKARFYISHFSFLNEKELNPSGFSQNKKAQSVWKKVSQKKRNISKHQFEETVSRFDRSFLDHGDEDHIATNIILHQRSLLDINVKVEVQNVKGKKDFHCIAIVNRRASRTGFLLNLIRVFNYYKFDIHESRSIYVPEDGQDETVLNHFYVSSLNHHIENYSTQLSRLLESLSIVQWFEFENPTNRNYVYELGFSIHHSILLRSIEEFIYQMLVVVDDNLYTPNQIHEAFSRHPNIARSLVETFSWKFNPVLAKKDTHEEKRQETLKLINNIDSGIVANDERRKTIFQTSITFIDCILKTNYYVIRRSALSFRLDPKILDLVGMPEREKHYPEIPYGIFFIKGKNFIAFNVRFRDFSRGGVRTLIPLDDEQLLHQQKDVFRECYHLAFTQQKKNKDIPEGGAKSIIFVKPYLGLDREMALDKDLFMANARSKQSLGQMLSERKNLLLRRQLFDAQRSFCDTLLDLLIWDDSKASLSEHNIHDFYGKEELIYLGPDENMTDDMIHWMCERSENRHYRVGTSFISGKKDRGINHKAYGVTSLGVHEYFKQALKSVLGNPKSFSVKISGGPDGDVAGNEIKNIIHDFNARSAKILCVQDGTAIVYDPKGLNHQELFRLFKQQQGVAKFSAKKLHTGGFQLLIHDKRSHHVGMEEVRHILKDEKGQLKESWIGASDANSIYHHFLHQLKCDVFLPCGGRPRTLNGKNWEEFLDEDGQPTAKVIVEGANLYLSDRARLALEEQGCVIVKDSSGNKCGVICSSYEVLSNALLSHEQFSKLKSKLVKDILKILKDSANKEAKILFESTDRHSLVEVSDRISDQINVYTDTINAQLHLYREKPEYRRLLNKVLSDYIPSSIRELSKNKVFKLPQIYQDAIISCTMACHFIYQHGLNYKPSIIESVIAELKYNNK